MAGPSAKQDPKFVSGPEVPSNTLVFREFGGVNVTSPRQSIGDEQFSWLENVMPIAPGNLPVMNVPMYTGVSHAAAVIYQCTANITGTDYDFEFLSDGSAFYTAIGTFVSTSFAPAGTFTAPQAIPYTTSDDGTPGLLIIDPANGYYDFGLTAPLTLTKISGSLAEAEIINPGGGYTSSPTATITGGGGTGAIATTTIGVRNAVLAGAGTGYLAGDLLAMVDGTNTDAAVMSVTTVNSGTGAITAFSIEDQGTYTVAPSNPVSVTGGAGSGATFTLNFGVTGIDLTNPGTGYTSTPTVALSGGGGTGASASIQLNGDLNGSAIAAYAGRVWISSGKITNYTDIDSYNSFGGAGGSFTINDSYLHNGINALYSANGYLYFFGDDSIDILSNVQVSNGVTTFSRTNITASVGTAFQQSVFPYYRSLMFANQYGIYALSGATPQKISDDIDGLFKPGIFLGGLVAGAVTIFGELCMCWTMKIVDNFTSLYGGGTTRTILVCYFKQRWFFSSPGFDFVQIASVPSAGGQSLFAVSAGAPSKLYQAFEANESNTLAFVQTKLWDGGAPIQNKELTRAGLSVIYSATVDRTLIVTTDNEFLSQPISQIGSSQVSGITFVNNLNQALQFINNLGQDINFFANAFSYSLEQGASTTNGGKYFGMSVTAHQTDINFPLFAVQYRNTVIW